MGRRRDWPLAVHIFVLSGVAGVIFALALFAFLVVTAFLWHHRVEIATVLRAWGIA